MGKKEGRVGGDADGGKVHREGGWGVGWGGRGVTCTTEEGAGPGEGRDRGRQLKRWQEGNKCQKKKKKGSRLKTVEETGAVRQSETSVSQRGSLS